MSAGSEISSLEFNSDVLPIIQISGGRKTIDRMKGEEYHSYNLVSQISF